MKLPFIRGALALFLRPSYVKRISREHHQFLASASGAEKEQEEPWADQQITVLRAAWLRALLTVVLVLLAGWAGGHSLAAYVGDGVEWRAAIQYTGAGLLLWVTLGQGGFSIQSMDGGTFAEQLDRWVYRIIHVIGTFLFVAGTAWQLAAKV